MELESLPAAASKKLTMIVDDDAGVREYFKFFIANQGFRVKTVGDGDAAVTEIRADRPDLILLDLMLPLRDGIDVLRELRRGDTEQIPVIVISGYNATRKCVEAIKRDFGVLDFLEKPVNLPTLTGLMRRALLVK